MIQLEEVWGALHLVGLCLAFGGVCVADFSGLALLMTSNRKSRILPTVEHLHISISLGLVVLIASGTAILNSRFDSFGAIPDKIWAKAILVSILIINGVCIQRYILPKIQRLTMQTPTQPLITLLKKNTRLQFALCSSLSSVGWVGGFCLGRFTPFKTMPFLEIMALLGALWCSLFIITLTFLDITAHHFRKDAERLAAIQMVALSSRRYS